MVSEEAELWIAYQMAKDRITKDPTVENLLVHIARLRRYIDSFFEHVLVMDKNVKDRERRLTLCYHIGKLTDGIVDLSKLEKF